MSESQAPAAAPASGSGSASAPERAASLSRDANFLTFWTGQALSQLGAQISMLALPVIAVLMLGASELEIGALNAADTSAFLLVGLPAGAWIDRMRKRRVMIAADAGRALALIAIPALFAAGALEFWHLIVIGVVVGVATVFFDVSYQSFIPSLVRPGQISSANGRLEATQQVARLAGPAAGGWIIGALSAPLAMLATAGTYALSLLALLLTRDREEPRHVDDREPLVREIVEGLRFVFGQPLLRRIVMTTCLTNLFGTLSFTLLPIFVLRELGLAPEAMGLMLSLSAVGGLAGAAATPRLARRIGEARMIPVAAFAFGIAALLFPVAAVAPSLAMPLLIGQGLVLNFSILAYNVTQVTFRQRITPPRLLGRMNASIRFVVWGVMPLAALGAGALSTWIGLVPTLWIAAAGSMLAVIPVASRPFLAMRDLPGAGASAGARST